MKSDHRKSTGAVQAFQFELKLSKREVLLRSVAAQQAIKSGVPLAGTEMHSLVGDLFACAIPNSTASGGQPIWNLKRKRWRRCLEGETNCRLAIVD
jgi:DNA mismatch repair protein MutL